MRWFLVSMDEDGTKVSVLGAMFGSVHVTSLVEGSLVERFTAADEHSGSREPTTVSVSALSS